MPGEPTAASVDGSCAAGDQFKLFIRTGKLPAVEYAASLLLFTSLCLLMCMCMYFLPGRSVAGRVNRHV